MVRKNILVIGGTGLVGNVILRILKSRNNDFNFFIGSRQNNNTSNNLMIDVTNPSTFNSITANKIDLIVLCTIDSTNEILKFAIKNKLHYIDITKPTPSLMPSYELAKSKIQNVNSKIVFSSGWMGGIVPSLIDYVVPKDSEIEEIKLFIYYSIKDLAGKSSANFLAENISKPFAVYENNKAVDVKHFLNSEKYKFSFGIGKRQVYNLDVPDLYILNKIENIPTVSVKMTYNSKFVTRLMGCFQYLKIFNIMSLKEKKAVFGSSGNGDKTVFEVLTKTKKGTQKVCLQSAKGQAELTAFSTVLHIEKMLKTDKNGVYFSHQLHSPSEIYTALKTNDSFTLLN